MQFQMTLYFQSSMSDSQRYPLCSICVNNEVDIIEQVCKSFLYKNRNKNNQFLARKIRICP